MRRMKISRRKEGFEGYIYYFDSCGDISLLRRESDLTSCNSHWLWGLEKRWGFSAGQRPALQSYELYRGFTRAFNKYSDL